MGICFSMPVFRTAPASPAAPRPRPAYNVIADTDADRMLDEMLGQRKFRSRRELTNFLRGMAGEPGETPMPGANPLPPGVLKRAEERHVAKLEAEGIFE